MWVVTVNQPGFMPEAEPVECESWAEGFAALSVELNHTATAHDVSDANWRDAANAALSIDVDQPGTVTLHGYAHNLDHA